MVQILGYLGCVFLIFKGYEIVLLARMQDKDKDNAGLGALLSAIVVALAFAFWLYNQGSSLALPR